MEILSSIIDIYPIFNTNFGYLPTLSANQDITTDNNNDGHLSKNYPKKPFDYVLDFSSDAAMASGHRMSESVMP